MLEGGEPTGIVRLESIDGKVEILVFEFLHNTLSQRLWRIDPGGVLQAKSASYPCHQCLYSVATGWQSADLPLRMVMLQKASLYVGNEGSLPLVLIAIHKDCHGWCVWVRRESA